MKMFIFTIVILLFAGCNNQADFYVETKDSEHEDITDISLDVPVTENNITEHEKTEIYVHVCGEVNAPDVYQLEDGSRVFEAVLMAGGLTKEADITIVNQAKFLSDGEMIYIPAKGENVESSKEYSAADDGKININQASKSELMTLTGIGEAKADSIIAYRESNGQFVELEDIMKIEGIKNGVFLKIKDYIKIK